MCKNHTGFPNQIFPNERSPDHKTGYYNSLIVNTEYEFNSKYNLLLRNCSPQLWFSQDPLAPNRSIAVKLKLNSDNYRLEGVFL